MHAFSAATHLEIRTVAAMHLQIRRHRLPHGPQRVRSRRWKHRTTVRHLVLGPRPHLQRLSGVPLREDEGAWQVRWKLPWTYACLRHRRLMVDRCPACGTRFQRGYSAEPFTAQRTVTMCRAHPTLARCAQDLADARASSISNSPRLLTAQARIDDILGGQPPSVAGTTIEPVEYFDTLRSLSALILKTAHPGDLGPRPRAARPRSKTTAANATSKRPTAASFEPAGSRAGVPRGLHRSSPSPRAQR